MAIKELFYDQRPVALLNPRQSRRIDPRYKYTRNSAATFVDQTGVLRPNGAPSGSPRYSYDPATKEFLGLLIEESRQNILTYSEDLTGSSWTLSEILGFGSGSVANAAIAPDGTLAADKPVENAAASQPHLFNNTVPVVAGDTYTGSVYLKAAERSWVGVFLGGATFGGHGLYVNLSTGEKGVIAGSPISTSVENCGNGWFRVTVTKNATTTANGLLQIRFAVGNADYIYTGNGTSGVYVWGAQLEKGTHATSYIPTTTSAVTRAADILSVEIGLPSTGSVFTDARAYATNTNSTLLSLKNASNEKINLGMETRSELYNSLALTYSIKGTVKPTLPYPVPTTNRERNIITWGTQNYQYNTDGARFAPSLSTTPGIPADLTQLSIGHDAVDPTKAYNGYINAVYLYNGEISPTVAEALVRGELDPVNADTYSPVGPTGSLALIINTQGASSSGDKTFTLPAESALNDNDIVITWGDGTESGLEGSAAELGAVGLSHTYSSAGIYPIWVEGKLQNLKFNGSLSAADLVKIESWGTGDMFTSPSTMTAAFFGCSKLPSMPTSGLPSTSTVTDWYRAFRDCSSLAGTFPSFNFSSATDFDEAFFNCSSLTSFPAVGDQTQNVTNFRLAWGDCAGLTSFPLINTSAGTTFNNTWRNCTGLTSFPLLNTAASTDFNGTWSGCSNLSSFPLLNTAAGATFRNAWVNCLNLTSFPLINTALGTNFSNAWRNCSGLTSFPVLNTAAGQVFDSCWEGCSSLTSFPSLELNACIGLASDASSVESGFREAWRNCNSLTTFPANRFNTTTCTRYLDAWTGCALTAQSIENILVSIEAAGTSNGNLGIGGGTNAAKTTWSTAANTAYAALVARGWTITYNA